MDRSHVSYCSGECRSCPVTPGSQDPRALRGPRMVGAASLSFLLPLAGALTGAVLAGSEPVSQWLAAIAGLGTGAGLGRWIAGRLAWERGEARS